MTGLVSSIGVRPGGAVVGSGNKKAGVAEHASAFDHAGLLVNKPAGLAPGCSLSRIGIVPEPKKKTSELTALTGSRKPGEGRASPSLRYGLLRPTGYLKANR